MAIIDSQRNSAVEPTRKGANEAGIISLAGFIARGAEATLSEERWEGVAAVLKDRVVKGYRLPELDRELRLSRTRLERNVLIAARRLGVRVPRVLDAGRTTLLLEKIEGRRVKEALGEMDDKKITVLGNRIGEQVQRLHQGGMAHGDLTASNMILGEKLWLIDFGLAKPSASDEEKAADVFLFSESLKAIQAERLWRSFLKAYGHNNSSFTVIMQKYRKIASRRRYRG